MGNFNVHVPKGQGYQLQIVTKSGSHPVLGGSLLQATPFSFDVCAPGADFDLGDVEPFDFEEIDGDEIPWTETDDDCSTPDWLCDGETLENPDGTVPDCFEQPLPCEDPAANPELCWDEPLECSDSSSDPNFCIEEPQEPQEPEHCQDLPESEDCGVDDEWIDGEDFNLEECDEGGDGPLCFIDEDACEVTEDGAISCEGIGAAPEFPLPDFGCEDLNPEDQEDGEPEEDTVPVPEN